MPSSNNLTYRLMTQERKLTYPEMGTAELIELHVRQTAQLNYLLTQIADMRTTTEEVKVIFSTVMWLRQELKAIYWAIKSKK